MPTARRRLADVAWLDQKMQLGFLRRKVARQRGAGTVRVSIRILVVSNGVQPQPAVPLRRGNGTGNPILNRSDAGFPGSGQGEDHLRIPEASLEEEVS